MNKLVILQGDPLPEELKAAKELKAKKFELPPATDQELKATAKLQVELQEILEEHYIHYAYRALLHEKGFGTLAEFITLFENKDDLQSRAPRFFRYAPRDPAHPTREETSFMVTANERMLSSWQDAQVKITEVEEQVKKTKSVFAGMEEEDYESLLGSRAGHRLLKLLSEPLNEQIVEAFRDYFLAHYITGLHKATIDRLETDAAFCDKMRRHIFEWKKSKKVSRNLDEVSKFDGPKSSMADPSDTVKAIFQHWDKDHSGTLEEDEFTKLFVHLGMAEKDASAMFNLVDLDNSGGIDYNEFLEWLLFSGKSEYTATEGFTNQGVGSKEAAKAVRTHGENEVQFLPKQMLYNCSYIESSKADVYCSMCQKFYSKHGFDMCHKDAESRGHTVVFLVPGREYKEFEKEAFPHEEPKDFAQIAREAAEAAESQEVGFQVDNVVAAKALENELRKQFKAMDLDRSMGIEKEEMAEIFLAMRKYDPDHEKTRDQAKEEAEALFQRLDVNHDGEVTMDEFVGGMMEEAMSPDSLGPDAAATKAAEFTAAVKEVFFHRAHQKAKPKIEGGVSFKSETDADGEHHRHGHHSSHKHHHHDSHHHHSSHSDHHHHRSDHRHGTHNSDQRPATREHSHKSHRSHHDNEHSDSPHREHSDSHHRHDRHHRSDHHRSHHDGGKSHRDKESRSHH
jgi:Ca2+-binding EF-hand superfamily protein